MFFGEKIALLKGCLKIVGQHYVYIYIYIYLYIQNIQIISIYKSLNSYT